LKVTEQPATVAGKDRIVGRLAPWVIPVLGGIVALLAVPVAEIFPDGSELFGITMDAVVKLSHGVQMVS
jgi:hypothetical protein